MHILYVGRWVGKCGIEKIALSNEGCQEGTQVELHTLSCKL